MRPEKPDFGDGLAMLGLQSSGPFQDGLMKRTLIVASETLFHLEFPKITLNIQTQKILNIES